MTAIYYTRMFRVADCHADIDQPESLCINGQDYIAIDMYTVAAAAIIP